MSKQAAEHHLKAVEHHEQAAQHHREAAKRHEEDPHAEVSGNERSASGHLNARLFHAAVAEAIEHCKASRCHATYSPLFLLTLLEPDMKGESRRIPI